MIHEIEGHIYIQQMGGSYGYGLDHTPCGPYCKAVIKVVEGGRFINRSMYDHAVMYIGKLKNEILIRQREIDRLTDRLLIHEPGFNKAEVAVKLRSESADNFAAAFDQMIREAIEGANPPIDQR